MNATLYFLTELGNVHTFGARSKDGSQNRKEKK